MSTQLIKTPLISQYEGMKKKHPDAILLFRIGDFYETFSDDAVAVSKILGITLTRRMNGEKTFVELAGFPHHALDKYLPKLVRAGKRIAICEQLEDPKLTKQLVKREVSELITPNPKSQIKTRISDIFAILTDFLGILNKLSIFEEIRAKSLEIRQLAKILGISPRQAFDECGIPYQPTLFE